MVDKMMDVEKIVDEAFQTCMQRGWLKKLVPSKITTQDIADFEESQQLKLPAFYKAFLTAYQLPCDMYQICGIADRYDEIRPLWLILYSITDMEKLLEHIKFFQEDAEEFRQAPVESYKHLVPIGDWGAGWGPLCLDLTKAEEMADEEDENTWSLVWFDHEEFDWGDYYLEEDGLLHGTPAAPNFQTLLDWYFCGSLESEFEKQNQVKLSYERLNNMEFLNSYWEEKWKE